MSVFECYLSYGIALYFAHIEHLARICTFSSSNKEISINLNCNLYLFKTPGRVFPGKKMAGHMGGNPVCLPCVRVRLLLYLLSFIHHDLVTLHH